MEVLALMTLQPLDLTPDSLLTAPLSQLASPPNSTAQPSPYAATDAIRRFQPPAIGIGDDLPYGAPNGGFFGGGIFGGSGTAGWGLLGAIGGLLGQLGTLLQQLIGTNGAGGTPGYGGNETFFSSANGASLGDPHLSFNGTTWNSMTDHPDLLHSDSFAGGFDISTSVTQPNTAGITYNRQATITTDFGNTQVSLNNAGQATIVQNGQTQAIAPGNSFNLGDGDTVTRNQDGSLVFTAYSGNGGTITTTLQQNGSGVDVNVAASNVDLGGDLVQGAPRRAYPTDHHITPRTPTPHNE